MIDYVFFDVSGTLLTKPALFPNIQSALADSGHKIGLDEIKFKHKLLSEFIKFPDRTDLDFYKIFNSELLYALGILPTEKLLADIFANCTYLSWEKYEDTDVLAELDIPIGIISNFNTTLKDKLNSFFGPIFTDILVSEELGVAKPEVEFYKMACQKSKVNPQNILYIGDSIKLDLEPAHKVGMKSLLIDRDRFYKGSGRCIKSLHEIKDYLG